MPVEFTKEQQKVIDIRNCNVLVSAAAGSGKTAVLVQRIINIIMDETNPVDIDRLLVVTFTEAAANEMRGRILEAINAKLEENPSNSHLQKQSALLYKAQISTVHSFCLNLIRNNFNVIGLDPGFRVADEAELKLLSKEVLDGLFESKYAQKDEVFKECVHFFGKGVTDEALKDIIIEITKLAEGNPWPYEWLDECKKPYEIEDEASLNECNPIKGLVDYAKDMTKEAYALAKEALDICESAMGPVQYTDNIKDDIEIIDGLRGCNNYDAIYDYLSDIKYSRLSGKSPEGVSEELKEEVKAKRDSYKEMITGTKAYSVKTYFGSPLKNEITNMKKVRPYVETLVDLCKEYLVLFSEKKIDEGVISFSDMEHYAIRILYTEDENNCHVLSQTAYEYQNFFDEILMDEYQDCNRVQELLISAISKEKSGKFNRFLVGDVKQSIYKFRLSSPELFISKFGSYKLVDLDSHNEEKEVRIDLHKNFRSRRSVINTVNDLFGQIMHADLGKVEYDEEAKLVYGADYPECEGEIKGVTGRCRTFDTDTEIMLVNYDSKGDFKREISEAMMVADKIKSMVGRYPVLDKETGVMRPCDFRDIVILVRSGSDVAMGLKYVFGLEGIPSHMPLKAGFYQTPEIQQIVQLLKVFDNPMQDIALYGSLKSFFGGFTDEEIATLKISGVSLYKCLIMARDDNKKVDSFLKLIEEYRYKCTYMPINEVLSELIYDRGYLEYVSAMAGGIQKKANVNLLIDKALLYEKTSFKGLFHFINYLKEIIKSESEEGEADVLDENANVVRIMTIHKSKGLEFPICFLCGVHKQFNMQDGKGNPIMEMEYGLGISYIDTLRRTKSNTLYKKAVAHKITTETLGEELRVLYVALTRAKEKLIITGVFDNKEGKRDFDELIRDSLKYASGSDRIPYSELCTAKSYMDFLKPIMHKACLIYPEELTLCSAKEALDRLEAKGNFEKKLSAFTQTTPEFEALKSRIENEYTHKDLEGMVLKTSVSELKKAYLDYENTLNMYETESTKATDGDQRDKPEGKISATDRGSAYHKVMELLDFTNQDIKSQLNYFINNGLISKEWAEAVPIPKIAKFMESDLAKKMAKAQQNGTLKREQPFVLGIDASRVKPSYPEGEMVLLQGIIDAFFVENNEIILVDYKTDVIESGEKLMGRYHVQLEYYKEALERILEMKVKDCILYSFCLGETVYM